MALLRIRNLEKYKYSFFRPIKFIILKKIIIVVGAHL